MHGNEIPCPICGRPSAETILRCRVTHIVVETTTICDNCMPVHVGSVSAVDFHANATREIHQNASPETSELYNKRIKALVEERKILLNDSLTDAEFEAALKAAKAHSDSVGLLGDVLDYDREKHRARQHLYIEDVQRQHNIQIDPIMREAWMSGDTTRLAGIALQRVLRKFRPKDTVEHSAKSFLSDFRSFNPFDI